MFFNKKKILADRLFANATRAADASLELLLDDNKTVERWLIDSQGAINDWKMFATVATVFLGINAREKSFSDKDFRKLISLTLKKLKNWNPLTEEAFYDLADFVLTSQEKKVDSISATGLWVIYKVKKETPVLDEVIIGYNIGQFFNKMVVKN